MGTEATVGHEALKQLSQELFYHQMTDGSSYQALTKGPFFGLEGRATIVPHTSIHSKGIHVVWRIPISEQSTVLERPFQKYEDNRFIDQDFYALKAPVSVEYEAMAAQWLASAKEYGGAPYNRNAPIPQEDIRMLHPKYFVAAFDMKSTNDARKDWFVRPIEISAMALKSGSRLTQEILLAAMQYGFDSL